MISTSDRLRTLALLVLAAVTLALAAPAVGNPARPGFDLEHLPARAGTGAGIAEQDIA